MRVFTYMLLFFGIVLMFCQVAMAQTEAKNYHLLSKDQKLIIQRNVIDPLRVSNDITGLSSASNKKRRRHKTSDLSEKDIRKILRESRELEYIDKSGSSFTSYIPTNKIQKDLAFKSPTYYPSYYLNYQLRIKNISPKFLRVIKGGN